MKKVFGLTGEMASGKETVKKYLELEYGAESVRFSTILRDVLERVSLPFTRENLQDISTLLRQRFGEDVLSKAIAEDAKNLRSEIVVVDGVRRETDISHLKEIDGFHLIAIEAKSEIRFERMVRRNENVGDATKTYEQFMKEHEKETEILIPSLMKKADFTLNNDGDFDGLYKQIDELVTRL